MHPADTKVSTWSSIRIPGEIPFLFQRITASGRDGFWMGSRGGYSDEEPRHRVVLPDEFYLGTFVVTQAQYGTVTWRDWSTNPNQLTNVRSNDYRVVRGGSWGCSTWWCRSANRVGRWPGGSRMYLGIRLCLIRGPAS